MRVLRNWLRSPVLPLALTGLLALLYALLVAWSTVWGAWGYSDSAAYIAAARNLAAGLGLRLPDAAGLLHPSVLTPPLYTWVLSLGAWAGLDALDWARALAVGLAFLFPAVLGLLAWRTSGTAWFAPFLAGWVVLSPVLFTNAASAMSEQLFLCLGFSGLLLFLPGSTPSLRRLLLSAALIGLAGLTRYLGAAFILAACLLAWAKLKSLRRAALYALLAALPLIVWLGWTALATETLGARSLSISAAQLSARAWTFLHATGDILSAWIPYASRGAEVLPARGKLIVLITVWLAAAAWGLAPLRGGETRKNGGVRLLLTGLGFSLAYLLVLALTYLLADIPPDLIPRMVSPLLPASFLLLLGTAQLAAERLRRKAVLYVILFAAVSVYGVYFTPQLSELARRGHTEGMGYTSRVWRESPVFDQIRGELDARPIITDEPALVLLYTGRGAYPWNEWVGGNLRAAAGGDQPGHGQGRLHDLVRAGAALVIFPPRVEEEYGPDSRALLAQWTAGMDALYMGREAQIMLSDETTPHSTGD